MRCSRAAWLITAAASLGCDTAAEPAPPVAGCEERGARASAPLLDAEFPLESLLPDQGAPWTTDVRTVDLVGDGTPQLLLTDPNRQQLTWLRDCGDTCEAVAIPVKGRPVRAQPADLDGDGDRDLIVADIGVLATSDTPWGRVLWLDNDGAFAFTEKELLSDVGRVSCAKPADLDGDGDLDVLTCIFGNTTGSLRWLEQTDDGSFHAHIIEDRPGAVDAHAVDADGDGDLDVVAAYAQLEELVVLYENRDGQFVARPLFRGSGDNFGTSSLTPGDLDHDGDTDFVLTNGDIFDYDWRDDDVCSLHGVTWLENRGGLEFASHELARFVAAYAADVGDLDGDGDADIVVSSLHDGTLRELEPASVIWLENQGGQTFARRDLSHDALGGVAIEIADYDADGAPDILLGSMSYGRRLGLLRNRLE